MADLEAIPEKVYIRLPNGTLKGPMSKTQLEASVQEGNLSIFCWIYDEEKRASAPLKSFQELYSTHPDSNIIHQYFPKPIFLTLAYYLGLVSMLTITMFGISAFIGLLGLACCIIYAVAPSTQPKKFTSQKFVLAIITNAFSTCMGFLMIISVFTRLLGWE
ncbi:MAG: hypothetical protein ACFCU1_03255 [Sumerlaeia bacterium]